MYDTKMRSDDPMLNPRNLREALKGILTEKEMEKLITSFDIVGTIAVIEIPDELSRKERKIGEALMKVHRNVKTVCKFTGAATGVFRIRPVEVIAGVKTTKTEHVESGVRMRLDLNKAFFSARSSHGRERIAAMVKPGEVVGVFFAGVGPSALVIAKKQPKAEIYAIELNPDAYRYMEENIRINKMSGRITPVFGDVREVAPKLLAGKCDRIVMPLPKDAESFLDVAFECAAPHCVIHLYRFGPHVNPFDEAEKTAREIAKKCGRAIKKIDKVIVGSYSPDVVRIVLDITLK